LDPNHPKADYAEHRLQVSLLQTAPMLGGIAENLSELERLIEQASGVDIVVTPELATHGYDLEVLNSVDAISPMNQSFRALGSKGVAVLVGFVEEGESENYNSVALLGANSAVTQRKLTLPNYDRWHERDFFTPGNEIRHFSIAGVNLVTLICNDAWQPQFVWLAAQAGAEVVFVPSNSVKSQVGVATDEAWEMQLRGLAVALQIYIVFVNRVGEEPCGIFWGGSAVYGPDGSVLAKAGDKEEVLTVDLDINKLREMRRKWPLLDTPRWDVVTDESRKYAGVTNV
jgi:predicted amidohydrolase